jgi:hypothetical protein
MEFNKWSMSTNISVCSKQYFVLSDFMIYINSDHTDKVLCVQFNWDFIVSGSTDKTIKV